MPFEGFPTRVSMLARDEKNILKALLNPEKAPIVPLSPVAAVAVTGPALDSERAEVEVATAEEPPVAVRNVRRL